MRSNGHDRNVAIPHRIRMRAHGSFVHGTAVEIQDAGTPHKIITAASGGRTISVDVQQFLNIKTKFVKKVSR
jgi:hypothetical protein